MARCLKTFVVWGILGAMPTYGAHSEAFFTGNPVASVSALFADETREVFRLSPEGSLVAFLHFDGSINRLCVGDPKNLAATTLTATEPDDGSVFSFLWVDDTRIAFASRKPDRETRIGCVQIRKPPEECGQPDIRIQILAEGAAAGRLAGVFTKGNAGRVLLSISSGKSDGISDIFAVDPATRERELIHRNVEGLPILSVSRNGEALAGIRCLPDGRKQLIGICAGDTKTLLTCSAGESLNIVGMSSEGDAVYVVTDQGTDTEFTRLEVIHIASGKRTVIGSDSRQAADLDEAVFDWSTSRVLACRFYYDRPEYLWLSTEAEKLFNAICRKLGDGDIRLRDSSVDGKKWLVSVTRDTEPDAEYFYESETESLIRLDSRTTFIPATSLGRMKTVRYQARDKQTISGYLTFPPGGEEANLPVVVFPHGGPNKRNYWGYDPRVQFFASRGYAVFQPNFRGSSGFGKTFQNAGNGQWGRGVMQDDISDGVAWLIASGIADPKRIAIVGGSYGGFAALAGLAFTPDLYACGVCLFGASNLPDFIREIPDSWKPFYGDLAVKIGSPDSPSDARRLAQQSPIHFTDQIRVPVLVYHGAHDKIVRQFQADRFVAACRKSQVNVDYLSAANEGHGFTDALNEQAVYIAIERFLAAHIGGQCQHDVPTDIEKRLSKLRSSTKQ